MSSTYSKWAVHVSNMKQNYCFSYKWKQVLKTVFESLRLHQAFPQMFELRQKYSTSVYSMIAKHVEHNSVKNKWPPTLDSDRCWIHSVVFSDIVLIKTGQIYSIVSPTKLALVAGLFNYIAKGFLLLGHPPEGVNDFIPA